MNINVPRVRGREVVRDLGLGVLEECDVCINNKRHPFVVYMGSITIHIDAILASSHSTFGL